MSFFRLERQKDNILFAYIDNPDERINTLSGGMLAELEDLLNEIEVDHFAKALVFLSAKSDNFIVGADIKDFDAIADSQQAVEIIRRLHALLNRVANLSFPAIAAINGPCLGGGLEFALACHFRIATDWEKTVLGLPEIKLGIFPAGGGTQRLTRLIGVRKALPLMLTGRSLRARQARRMGLVDFVVFPDALPDSAARCIPMLRKKFPPRQYYPPRFSLDWVLRASPARKVYFGMIRRQIRNRTADNYPAAFRLVDCVEAGIAGTVADGYRAEEEALGPLVLSPASRALRDIFFLQQKLKKKEYGGDPREAKMLGVLGGGFMGSGIAIVSAKNGLRVALKDVSQDSLTKSLGTIWKHFDRQVRSHRGNPVERDKFYSLVVPCLDYRPFTRADMVIEAVFEDLALKQQVLREVEEHIPRSCIFASNTSAIPISSIAAASKRPQNVIGMHYFSPVPRMPLLEIVVTAQCADWVVATAVAVGRKQGKTVIVVKDGPGFYTTRILMPVMLEAVTLLGEGATVRDVDNAMRRFGFPVGPLSLVDEVGIDVAAHIAREMEPFFLERNMPVPGALTKILESGLSGRKKGMGFYQYAPRFSDRLGAIGFKPQRRVNEKIYGYFSNRGKRAPDESEIRQRLVYLMVNEAAFCLQEGIISSPEDGDLGAVFGLGFPPFLGGPFRYLDTSGIGPAVSGMEGLAGRLGARFQPAPILVHMAEREDRFYA